MKFIQLFLILLILCFITSLKISKFIQPNLYTQFTLSQPFYSYQIPHLYPSSPLSTQPIQGTAIDITKYNQNINIKQENGIYRCDLINSAYNCSSSPHCIWDNKIAFCLNRV